MRTKLLLLFLLGMASLGVRAQRTTDALDRGLVAVKTTGGVYCSWRITAEEYYDVTYNIYRDGTKLNATPLTVSNYTDAGGALTSSYTVEAVVRGTAQAKCAAVTPWAKNFMEIKMDHGSLTSTYVPNDACVADVDGDGELEILLKFDNQSEIETGYMPNGYNGEYAIVEVYKLNGKKLWWLDFGPNMSDFQNNENNIVAYDWDGDGKAEAVMRAADGTTIHMADGTTYVVGDASKNYRSASGGGGANYFMHDGDEFLLYLNGETGKPYQCLQYPLKRLEAGETNLETAWGDGYGHRSTKHFFGAPYLDGRKPSIFLARGIYTRHKMIALDVDAASHTLTTRWTWNCNTPGSAWYGQGFHNFCIADVDWDGRDEIVFGSMVIDDTGIGLSTTGLGHGDSQHCGDFDPYSHGQEIFTCQEELPNNCYRDATTGKIYYRTVGTSDDGRAIMGNFIDDIPGCQGVSAHDDNVVNSVTHEGMAGLKSTVSIAQNFRIYWDGDLCSESFNYANGKNTAGTIYKARKGVVATLEGSLTNNDTKGTPCYQGDILGDWREEVIMRTADNNIRIYTTNIETPWRNYTLWHDHQYRQSMVWQMCGYNQTPHTSYFLGELEGITKAPAPLTMAGRTEIANNGTIGTAQNDKHIMMCETNDMTVSVAAAGASPYILTVNAPTWVQGTGNNANITTTTYTHTITGGPFTGAMRLVKQGDGVLTLPNVTQTYSGQTDVWAGVLNFDGTMQQSRVWLNRFAELNSNGGTFSKGIEMDYAAVLRPGGKDKQGTVTADSLILNYGAVVEIDLYSDGNAADLLKVTTLKIDKKDWENGPAYLTPVLRFVSHAATGETELAAGKYLIGEIGKVDGSLDDLVIEGLTMQKTALSLESGKLYLTVQTYTPGSVVWTGSEDGIWNLDETPNFSESGTSRNFVPGDAVTFNDDAVSTDITVDGTIHPAAITFANETKAYTLSGDDIVGGATFVKTGAGALTISNHNDVKSVDISGGTVNVTTLANNIGRDIGALGSTATTINLSNGAVLGVAQDATVAQPIAVGAGGGTVSVAAGKTLNMENGFQASVADAVLTKSGNGTLNLGSDNKVSKLVINQGVVNVEESGNVAQLPATVELRGGTLYDPNTEGMPGTTNSANFVVPEGCTGTFYADPRSNYTGTLTGSGTFNVYGTGVRCYFAGDWSQFEGTIVPGLSKRGTYDPSFDFTSTKGLGKATLQLNDGFTFNNNGNSMEIGAVTGTGTLSGTGTYTIGSNNEDFSFAAYSNSKIIKRGTGAMTLITYGRINASLTIAEGTLKASGFGFTTKLIGDNTLTLTGNAKMIGQASVSSIMMDGTSELTLCSAMFENTPTTIKTSAIMKSEGSSTVNFLLADGSNSSLEVTTFLYLPNINIQLVDGYTPKGGEEFTLWTCRMLMVAPTNISLPTLPTGLSWDTTGLSQATGVLKITGSIPDGIEGIASQGDMRYEVYTLNGIKVGETVASKEAVAASVRALGVKSGTYIIRCKTATGTEVRKVVVR